MRAVVLHARLLLLGPIVVLPERVGQEVTKLLTIARPARVERRDARVGRRIEHTLAAHSRRGGEDKVRIGVDEDREGGATNLGAVRGVRGLHGVRRGDEETTGDDLEALATLDRQVVRGDLHVDGLAVTIDDPKTALGIRIGDGL